MVCPHLQQWLDARGDSPWLPLQRALLRAFKTPEGLGVVSEPHEHLSAYGSTPFACLTCGKLGSYQRLATHRELRAGDNSAHDLLVDLERKELLCLACGDYIYDEGFDEAVMATQALSLRRKGRNSRPGSGTGPSTPVPITPRSTAGVPCIELPRSWQKGAQGASRRPVEGATVVISNDGLPLGLRGLSNLGNTCFMNTVLQAMLHAPLMRAFFLGAGHPRESCQRRAATGQCLTCELDRTFGELYSGARQPFSPVDLLYSWWSHADHLAGYQQQDAHEFYLTTLCAIDGAADGVRGMLRKHLWHESPQEDGLQKSEVRDESIAESVFGGILRSDVTCQGCGYTSTAYDPFLDISLDLPRFAKAPTGPAGAAVQLTGPGSAASDGQGAYGSGLDSGLESSGAGTTLQQARSNPHSFRKRPRGGKSRGSVPPQRVVRGYDTDEGSAAAEEAPSARQPPPATPMLERHDSWQNVREILPEATEDDSTNDMQSEADGGSSIAGGGAEGSMDLSGDATSPATAERPPLPLTTSGLPAEESPAGSAKKGGRLRRCGHCYHCVNKHLKKACLSNIKEREGLLDQPPSRRPGPGATGNGDGIRAAGSKGALIVGGDFAPNSSVAASLVGCLHSFIRSEKLGANEHWVCGHCQQQQQAVKQMSIRRLPPVLCLHIKRFEHHRHKKGARKVDTPLIFPELHLDMSPFTSSSVLRSRFMARSAKQPRNEQPGKQQCYELYAVISHRGKMDGGHYIAFLKVDGQWYQCDDAWVVPVEAEVVKKCQAYMLYYKRKGHQR
mmetsp:Transcript_40590/g.114960  ORF Transcript_40590/g.114960 Transcript_40590/m.114960 type:complete len:787 (-) Transcript_40590:77-2437(-)